MVDTQTHDKADVNGENTDRGSSSFSESPEKDESQSADRTFSAESLRGICLEEGADDAGFVEVDRAEIASERDGALRAYPKTKTVISIIKQTNREAIQSASLAVVDEEYRATYGDLDKISKKIIKRLNALGIRGVTTPTGFPMDMTQWPGKIWDVGHKTVAVEAGLR